MRHIVSALALVFGAALIAAAGGAWSGAYWQWLAGDAMNGWSPYMSWERWRVLMLFAMLLLLGVALPSTWVSRAWVPDRQAWVFPAVVTTLVWAAAIRRMGGGLPWSVCLLEALPVGTSLAWLCAGLWPASSLRVSRNGWLLACLPLVGYAIWDGSELRDPVQTVLTVTLMPLLLAPIWAPPLIALRWPRAARALGGLLTLSAFVMLGGYVNTMGLEPEGLLFSTPLLWLGLAHLSGWSWGDAPGKQRFDLTP